jgi:hypothetical protein
MLHVFICTEDTRNGLLCHQTQLLSTLVFDFFNTGSMRLRIIIVMFVSSELLVRFRSEKTAYIHLIAKRCFVFG